MNRLIAFFFVALPLLLSCGKPAEKFVINPPSKPTGETGKTDPPTTTTPDPGTPTTTFQPIDPPTETVVVGYAVYWEDTMPDPALVTHINYAFAHIKGDFETLDIKKPTRLSKIAALKNQKPGLKVLLSVGGWEAGNFSEMAADDTHRKNFCNNCLKAVKNYNLDGIDIDWEYPTSDMAGISCSPSDTKNFTLLMRDLREVLGRDRLLTMASASNADYVNFKDAVQYMNFVNVMTYDMGDPPKHNAALYRSSMCSESCDESVTKHFNKGVPYEKIVLGIPFYGHGDGKAFGDYVDYKDIYIDKTKYTIMRDEVAKVPYVTANGKMVLTYDDAKSVGLKAEYVAQKKLAGAMYWNIEADDASFTLGNAVAEHLIEGYVPDPNKNPDAILVTNSYVEKYLEEVTYTDNSYQTTKILDYPGGGPGTADVPPVHTITWTSDASAGALNLKVWESDWSRDYTLSAGASSQDITNLVPGREYHYKVTASSGSKTVAEGSFKTKGMLHQVFFEPNVRNGRDLGGWKGLNGKTVAFRKVYRGGRLDGKYMNSTGKAEMRAEGIRAEVDLREAEDVPSKSPLGSDIDFYAPGFDSGYNHMVRDNPAKVKTTFEFVVNCVRAGKPVYFHCAAGRDRTGTLAVLLLGTLGVSESDMAKDYELTYFSPQEWSMSKKKDENDNYMKDENGNYIYYYNHTRCNYSYPSIRKTIFSQTDSGTYQDRIVKYLLQIGVSQKDIDDFRSLMLE